MKTNPDEARRLLVELLSQPDDKPVGIDGAYSHSQLNFLAVTCAATTMLWILTSVARGNYADAREGLKALALEKVLQDLCDDYKTVVH